MPLSIFTFSELQAPQTKLRRSDPLLCSDLGCCLPVQVLSCLQRWIQFQVVSVQTVAPLQICNKTASKNGRRKLAFSDIHVQMRMQGNLRKSMGFCSVSVFQIPFFPHPHLFLFLLSQVLQQVRSLALQHYEFDVVQHECACTPLPAHCKFVLFSWLF